MYLGEAQTVLDEKGRITVPRQFRQTMDVLGHVVWYMTRGFDHSISLFEQSTWEKICSQASSFPVMNAKALDFRRLLFGSAARIQLDRQGRMSVPNHLRSLAGLDREAVLIGVGDHLELWNRDAWCAFQREKEAEFKEMAGQLFVPQGGMVPAETNAGV